MCLYRKGNKLAVIMSTVLLFLVLTGFGAANAQNGPLYEYVFRPDPSYSYEHIDTIEQPGVTTYIINMTSQKWLDDSVSDRSIWWHYLSICIPDNVRFTDHAMLLISTGSNTDSVPGVTTKHVKDAITYSNRTGLVSAVVRQIPVQPLTFVNDTSENIKEDVIISFTWRQFLDDENMIPEGLLRFPMCKATARAMDTVTSFAKSVRPALDIKWFMLSGLSKRAWTLWLHAAIDSRVVAITPTVLTCLNLVENFHHYYQSKGGWPFALRSYWDRQLMRDVDHPRMKNLENMIDPYQYRQNLTMPKLMISGASDEFFMMDDYDYFFDDMVGDKYIWLTEKTGHGPDTGPLAEDFWKMVETFHLSVILDHTMPQFSWYRNTTSTGGSVTLSTSEAPTNVTSWSALTPDTVFPRRDFRLKMLDDEGQVVDTGIEWKEFPVEDLGDGNYRATYDNPPEGKYLAFFIKVHFPWDAEQREFIFTSQANIIPSGFPYPKCSGSGCQSSLV